MNQRAFSGALLKNVIFLIPLFSLSLAIASKGTEEITDPNKKIVVSSRIIPSPMMDPESLAKLIQIDPDYYGGFQKVDVDSSGMNTYLTLKREGDTYRVRLTSRTIQCGSNQGYQIKLLPEKKDHVEELKVQLCPSSVADENVKFDIKVIIEKGNKWGFSERFLFGKIKWNLIHNLAVDLQEYSNKQVAIENEKQQQQALKNKDKVVCDSYEYKLKTCQSQLALFRGRHNQIDYLARNDARAEKFDRAQEYQRWQEEHRRLNLLLREWINGHPATNCHLVEPLKRCLIDSQREVEKSSPTAQQAPPGHPK